MQEMNANLQPTKVKANVAQQPVEVKPVVDLKPASE